MKCNTVPERHIFCPNLAFLRNFALVARVRKSDKKLRDCVILSIPNQNVGWERIFTLGLEES